MKDKKKEQPKENEKLGISAVRHAVQALLFVLFAIPVLAAGWALFGLTEPDTTVITTPMNGVFYGTLSSSTVGPFVLIDPFAALQVIFASKSATGTLILGALLVVIVYGIIRGRAFCGWVCPVNFFLEGLDWLRNRLGIKVKEAPLPRHTKLYVALVMLVLSLVIGIPVYEIFNPIGAINKLIVVGSLAGVLTLIAIIIAELFWGHRVWCRSICPLGGFYEVLGKIGIVRVKINHTSCINCDKCKAVCIANPEILDPALQNKEHTVSAGDCMLCGKCVDVCPKDALRISVGIPEGIKKPQKRA